MSICVGFVTFSLSSTLPTAGSDYSGLTTDRTFNSGDQMMCVDISIFDDIEVEGFLESFTVSLSGNNIFSGQGVVSIIDNDQCMSLARTVCW